LLTSSLVRLFGRLFAGLQIHHADALAGESATSFSSGKDVGSLSTRLTEQDPKLATIYGFSFEGNYYKLPKPYIFLVHGEGKFVKEDQGLTGYGFEIKEAALFPDVRVWTYDKLDRSIRIDVASGVLEQILLEPASTSATNMTGGDLSARADLQSRADLQGRADLQARADLQMRGRFSR
jgi:hypothetical protein